MAKRTKQPAFWIYQISAPIEGNDDMTFEAQFKICTETKEIEDIFPCYTKDHSTGQTHPPHVENEKQFILDNRGYWQQVKDDEDDLEDESGWTESDNYQEQYAERNYQEL